MGLLRRLLGGEPQALDVTWVHPDQATTLFPGYAETESGAFVTSESAMRIAAVYACVRVIAEGVGILPLHLYRREADGGRARAADHWLYDLLHRRPNAWQTPYAWKEMTAAHLALHGNAFSLKTVSGRRTLELLPVPPTWVTVRWNENLRFSFEVRDPAGGYLEVPEDRMLFIRGLSLDGRVGLNPIAYHREAFGLAQQLNTQAGRLFRNGAQIAGVLQHPGSLSKPAADRLREQFDARYAGASNAWKTMLLEEGMKFEKVGMTAEDAQFLESRKFQRGEIATLFRVPPHMIGELDRATWSNIEQMNTEFVQYSLAAHLTRIEQSLEQSLLPEADRDTHFVQFDVNGLLRGDLASRFSAYSTARQGGWLSVNEIRQRENLNPIEGGDVYLTTPVGAAPNAPAAAGGSRGEP